MTTISMYDEDGADDFPDYTNMHRLPVDIDVILNVMGRLAGKFDDIKPNLSDVNFSYCDLSEKQMPRFNLRRSNLFCASLLDADLTNADFSSATLACTALENANMTATNLESANLHSANMLNAELAGANMAEARYDENILDAHYDEHTVFSDGRKGEPDISPKAQELEKTKPSALV